MFNTMFKLAVILNVYVMVVMGTIASQQMLVILTAISELLNLGRNIPAVLFCKVCVDIPKEYMKIAASSGTLK